jgi:hypothetical protein
MKCTVSWRKEVEDDLARIWLTAMDQQAFADAADAIDRQRRRDPYLNAKEVGRGTWAIVSGMLRAHYRVRPDDCVVEVIQIDLLDLP